MRLFLLALVVAVALPAAADDPAPPPGLPWASPELRDHPLAGRIWDPAGGRFVQPGELVTALRGARFLLLGERHDNADHHRFQAWAAEQLLAAGRRPALTMEMIDGAQQARLEAHRAAHPDDAAGLGAAIAWDDSGWPAWALYQPIVVPFLAAGLSVSAASLERSRLRQVMTEGLEVMEPGRVAALALEPPPDAALLQEMAAEIRTSHCDLLPDSMIGPMTLAARVKDAVMSEAMSLGDRASGDGALLIAGNGHVRRDRGVPWYLARLHPEAGVLAIGQLEVEPGRFEPADYGDLLGGTALPFDFVWFTPRKDLEDPCETHAEQLQRAKERHEAEPPASP